MLNRRLALTALAATGAAGFSLGATSRAGAAENSALLPGANVCVLTPQAVEGPFYFDPKLERSDITEGKPGVPLRLLLQVVSADDCKPITGARVDIWHADALGWYSGYAGQSDAHNVSTEDKHFLRGTQFSNAAGQVTFSTIYPGWYRGRTPHIHGKVFLDSKTVLTTQFYFPDALSEFIYQNVKPYNTRAQQRDTANATDGVLQESGGGHDSFVNVREEADCYVASLIIGVDRTAQSAPGGLGGPGGPPPGAGPGGPPPGGPPPGGPPQSRPRGSLVPGIVKSE